MVATVTWDAVNKGTGVVLSNNNLTATIPSNINIARASVGRTSGKWYWEITFVLLSNAMIGVVRENTNLNAIPYNTTGNAFYYTSGNKYPSASAYGQAYALSDVISVLLDMDLGTIEFWKNGISQGVMFNDLKNNTSPVYPAITSGAGNAGSTSTARFNINEFKYQPPEGYLAYDGSKSVTNKVLLLSNENSYSFEKGEVSGDLIPLMTSNTAPSGVVSSSNNSVDAYKVFNSTNTGGWSTTNSVPVNVGGHWIQYDFKSPKLINSFSLTSREISVGNMGVKNFKFYGSNDDVNFELLYTGLHPNSKDNLTYNIDNKKEYSIYRIVVIDSYHSLSHYASVSLIEMFKVSAPKLNQIPSSSEQNLIKYGMDSLVQADGIFSIKNYILQGTVSENAEGLWTTQLNRKPLSIKFN